jgi:hypothetical protein
MKITIPSHLSDAALVAGVKSLAGREREATAQLIAHLAEIDARRLHLGAGFPSAKSGHRCNARSFVEFHHLDPYGVGGEATVETMELRCRAHNNYEAELFYGRPQPTRPGTSSPPRRMAATGGP